MRRIATLAYGGACYALFFATFLYLLGFVSGLFVPVTIDSGTPGSPGLALVVDLALIALFGLQHSVMARPGFKERFTRMVPREIERSTYVLLSSLALIVLFAAWQPLPGVVWSVESPLAHAALRGLFGLGVVTVLYSTFLIDHFDLFGLRQVVLHFRSRAYTDKRFATPSLYRFVRHPLYVGWIITFWATPTLTVGHLILAAGMTGYILLAIPFEERDLVDALGEPYRRYRERTPALIPRLGRTPAGPAPARARAS